MTDPDSKEYLDRRSLIVQEQAEKRWNNIMDMLTLYNPGMHGPTLESAPNEKQDIKDD